MQNIITAIYRNESEGYQMITELRQAPVTEQATILQMALVKSEASGLKLCDGYDGIAMNADGAAIGGMVGALVGILGGPLGVLLLGANGAMIGSMTDITESVAGEALLETVANKLYEGEAGLVLLVEEKDEAYLDAKLNKFPCEIMRHDALDVADEVDEAIKIQTEMDRQARMQLREMKKEENRAQLEAKREARKAELEANFEEYKKNYSLYYPDYSGRG